MGRFELSLFAALEGKSLKLISMIKCPAAAAAAVAAVDFTADII